MCVAITMAPGTILTEDEVVRMDRANADGVGVAWANGSVVEWWKTTQVDPVDVARMITEFKELPRLVHFRLATAGGARPELCHPFEIGPLASYGEATSKTVVVGKSSKVLIHNGHWHKWNELSGFLNKANLLPPGHWSDSRLAAFLANEDPTWLEEVNGRIAVMLNTGATHRLGDWSELREGIHVSNCHWQTASVPRGGYTGYRRWKGWGWDEEEWAAFMAEEAEKEQQETKKIIAALEAEEAKKKETNAEKRERKRQARAEKRAKAYGGRAEEDTQELPIEQLGCNFHESGYCYNHRTAADHNVNDPQSTKLDTTPFQASNGLWYRGVEVKGNFTVVEITPPCGEGGACGC